MTSEMMGKTPQKVIRNMNGSVSKKQIASTYVGPRALFDPSYIPPTLLSREKELRTLSAVLFDGIQDGCPVSILLTGMEGIGKTSIARKSVATVKAKVQPIPLNSMYVNCKDKSIDEVLFALIHAISGKGPEDNPGHNYFEYTLSQLWAYLKALMSRAILHERIWIFDSIEDLDLQYFLKFAQLGKELGVSTVGSHDAPMKSSAALPKGVDIHLNLDKMTPPALYKVTQQRLRLTFPFQIPAEVPQAICDYVDSFDTPRPGTCIRVIKDVYPVLKQEKTLPAGALRQACQRQVPGINIDDFQILNDVLDHDVVAQLFIDNLATYFQSGEYYIPENALREQYQMAVETIEAVFDPEEFHHALITLIRSNILKESRVARARHRAEYMLVPPPELLKGAVDVVFAGVPS